MAGQQQNPKIVQQLIDLYQQVDRLTRSQAENMAKISAEAGNTTKEINRLQNELNSTENSFSSIAGILKSSVQEFSKYNTTASNTKKSFSSLQSISSKLLSDQSGFSRLSEKELIKLKEKLTLEAQNLSLNVNSTDLTEEQQQEVAGVLKLTEELTALLKERLDREKEITKAVGVTGNALKGLSKIPGIGSMLKTEEAMDQMKELADTMQAQGKNVNSFSNKLKLASVGLKTAVGGIKEALTDPVTILTFIGDALLKGSTGIANFRKELGLSYGQAYELNTQLNFVGNNVFDAYINGEKLKKSFIDLSQSMGFVADYGNEALVSMTNLTGKLGLSNQEAAQLTTLSRLQSKDTEKVLTNVGKTVSAMNKQGKTTVLLKDVMKEVANVSKATAVTLGGNPVKIAEAVVAAKQLGTTLQQIETTADSLLNFETSIDNELKAELLTGKQLNLERARAAALAGDQKTLAEELTKNVGSLADFSKMNVLQQKALAEAMGMSREELAKTLLQQEAMTIGAEGIRAKYGEQTYEQLKAQAAQEKFANSVEKLKSAFSSVVQIFSPLIDLLAGAAELIANITSKWYILYPLIGVIALSYIPKMAAGFANMGKSIAGMAKNFTSLFSKEGRSSLFGGAAGGADKAKETADKAKETAEKTAGAGEKAGKGGPKAGDGIKNTLKGISAGISSFSKVKPADILKLAGSAIALVALTPAIPALLALQFVKGKLIESALTGLGKGLAALGKALANPQVLIGLGAFTLVMMGLGKALSYASPAIEAFGKAIKSAFEGVGTIITAAANGIATIFTSLQNVDVTKLLAIGPALVGIGIGLASLGAGGVIGAIGSFLSGDPIEKLKGLAASGDGLTKTATALQAIAGALIGVSAALASIDTSKLEALDNFSNNQSSNSAINGITNFITAPIKAIGEVIGGGDKEEIKAGVDLTPMIAAINEVKASVDRLYNKNTTISMDSKQVGSLLVQGSRKFA